MKKWAYYNEIDGYAAQWIRNLIAAGHVAPGEVDERSIEDVHPDDVRDFAQCHWFAGVAGWSYAARLAGWPDDRPLWTGSCPCQPYSLAGKGLGEKDERDLWPVWFGLVAAVRPPVVMGEQVKDAIGKHWLDRMRVDMEAEGYALGAAVLPACSVDAPHRRDRLWFVADTSRGGRSEECADPGRVGVGGAKEGWPTGRDAGRASLDVAHPDQPGAGTQWQQRGRELGGTGGDPRTGDSNVGDTFRARLEGHAGDGDDRRQPGRVEAHSTASAGGSVSHTDSSRPFSRDHDQAARHGKTAASGHWSNGRFVIGSDGKARRVEPGIRLLAHGVSGRMAVRRTVGQGAAAHEEEHWYNRIGALRAFGNAIVPQVAAEVIGAYLDAEHLRLSAPSALTTDAADETQPDLKGAFA